TPVLFYGEEIGMGENREQAGRQSVRTPMQWDDQPNGGFSRAPDRKLVAKPPTDGYAPEHVNVEAQRHDPESLLGVIRSFAAVYRNTPEIGWGRLDVLEHDQDAVLAHRITADLGRFVAAHNFAPRPTIVPLELGPVAPGSVLSDLFSTEALDLDERGRVDVHLDAYGYRWFRIVEPDDRRLT
ncbi:MAG: trehalose synthase, partial [Actinomycetota bacterium]|nr:trehalose synthase [Actinomycetota bacterium]